MTYKAKGLLAQLFQEMTGKEGVGFKPGDKQDMPTVITRQNLNDVRGALTAVVATCSVENEYDSDDVLNVGNSFFKGLQKAEVALGKPGEAMTWQDVREVYRTWFEMAAEALTPEGVAKTIAAMKPKPLAKPTDATLPEAIRQTAG